MSSIGVIHRPSRLPTVIGRVGQKKKRLRIPVTGLGKACFWLRAYSRTVVPTRRLLQEHAGIIEAAAVVALRRNKRCSSPPPFLPPSLLRRGGSAEAPREPFGVDGAFVIVAIAGVI